MNWNWNLKMYNDKKDNPISGRNPFRDNFVSSGNPFRDSLARALIENREEKTIPLLWAPDSILDAVILDPLLYERTKGVYVIWFWEYDANSRQVRRVLKVGQGQIKSRLREYRKFAERVYPYKTLWATWAIVSNDDLDGVEKYVGKYYLPGGLFPKKTPRIKVNLPW